MTDIIVIREPNNQVIVASSNSTTIQETENLVVIGAPGPQGAAGAGSDQLLATFIAGANLSGHMVVTRLPDGTIDYASNNVSAGINGPLWMTTAAGVVGTSVPVLITGVFSEPSWSWTPGSPIYLGVGGVMTQTVPIAPSVFLVQVGYATSGTSIYFDQYPAIRLT